MIEILAVLSLILFFVFLKMGIASYFKKTPKKLLYFSLSLLSMLALVVLLILFPNNF